MPTLDDAPTLEKLLDGDMQGDDLIQIYDSSAQKAKTVSLDELIDYIVANTSATEV